jgi:hypothetical protein
LATARATVATLEAALAGAGDPATDLLSERQTMAEYGVARDGLLAAAARGEITLSRGPRNRIQVERQEIERWMKARPFAPRRKRRVAVEPANDLDTWSIEAERALRATGGE